jgi:AraC-like DNA-binding protein
MASRPLANLKHIIDSIPLENHFQIHQSFNVHQTPPSWGFKDRVNSDYHIIFVRGGRGSYFLEGREELLFRGKIIFVSDGLAHTAIQNTFAPLSIIPIRFGLYYNSTGSQLFHFTEPFSLAFIPEDIPAFENLFFRLWQNHSLKFSSYCPLVTCNSIMTTIFVEMYRELRNREEGEVFDNRLERARMYMEEHPFFDYNLKHIASIANLSEKYFTKLFKDQYGVNPRTYLLNARMHHVRYLLEYSDKSIKEIAYEIGYADQYIFSKQFKKVLGVPPSFYKRRYLEAQYTRKTEHIVQ